MDQPSSATTPATTSQNAGPTPQTGRCRVCGGEARPFAIQFQGQWGWRPVAIRNPDGRREQPPGGSQPQSECRAWVCRACGYAELYVVDRWTLFAE